MRNNDARFQLDLDVITYDEHYLQLIENQLNELLPQLTQINVNIAHHQQTLNRLTQEHQQRLSAVDNERMQQDIDLLATGALAVGMNYYANRTNNPSLYAASTILGASAAVNSVIPRANETAQLQNERLQQAHQKVLNELLEIAQPLQKQFQALSGIRFELKSWLSERKERPYKIYETKFNILMAYLNNFRMSEPNIPTDILRFIQHIETSFTPTPNAPTIDEDYYSKYEQLAATLWHALSQFWDLHYQDMCYEKIISCLKMTLGLMHVGETSENQTLLAGTVASETLSIFQKYCHLKKFWFIQASNQQTLTSFFEAVLELEDGRYHLLKKQDKYTKHFVAQCFAQAVINMHAADESDFEQQMQRIIRNQMRKHYQSSPSSWYHQKTFLSWDLSIDFLKKAEDTLIFTMFSIFGAAFVTLNAGIQVALASVTLVAGVGFAILALCLLASAINAVIVLLANYFHHRDLRQEFSQNYLNPNANSSQLMTNDLNSNEFNPYESSNNTNNINNISNNSTMTDMPPPYDDVIRDTAYPPLPDTLDNVTEVINISNTQQASLSPTPSSPRSLAEQSPMNNRQTSQLSQHNQLSQLSFFASQADSARAMDNSANDKDAGTSAAMSH